MTALWNRPGDPTRWAGVEVIFPELLSNVEYDRKASTLRDLDSGDELVFGYGGHGGHGRGFSFRNSINGPISLGSYLSKSVATLRSYVIIRLCGFDDNFRFYRSREGLGLGKLPMLFRSYVETVNPSPERRFAVVDARPRMNDQINPKTGSKKEAQ
ncbi:MAG: hypothetical protein AAFQ34_11840 [Pseudomonadota bacterium]